jgi:hypothetical protein
VIFASEVRRSAGLERDALPGVDSRVLAASLLAVFLLSFFVLFFGMSRRPGMYDEGIVLTGAMRVAAGQIPHRDFYFIYGPAEIYVLAGLFRTFGPSVLAERLFDLFIKAMVVTSVFAILAAYCRNSVAVFISIVNILWLFGLNEYGLAIVPVSVLNLISSALILPIFENRLSRNRMMVAGGLAGVACLFRYDTGIALLGIHATVIAIAVYLRHKGIANGLRTFASTLWPYLLGFGVLITLPALYYFSVAPLAPILHDVVLFPAQYYHRGRNVPFPGIHLKYLENLGVYLPIAIAGVSFYALVHRRLRVDGIAASGVENAPEEQKWHGFLITFGLLLLVMYLKGLVRAGPVQMYLAIIPSLLLVAVLFQHRSTFPSTVRITISGLMGLSLVPAAWTAMHELRLEYLQQSFLFTRNTAPGARANWCKLASPLTTGICFLPEDDRIQAIEYIRSRTQPGQPLYSGLSHHDRVFANDNLIYFATQRLPATRWSHFDPDLQNRYDIQMQIVHELEQKPPPYIMLDSEFDLVREPNDSSLSSGVTLLDDYIHDKYQPSEAFDKLSIWHRRNP